MSVSAKFKVQRVTPQHPGKDGDGIEIQAAEIELVPDYAGDRNKDWSRWTPSGVIRMNVQNPAALEQFQVGQAFTVLFEPTE